MSRYRILIPDHTATSTGIERSVFGAAAELILGRARDAREIPDSVWRRADAILAWHELEYDAELIARLDRCRVIVRVGVGYDNVDLAAAGARGITVCNVPDYGTGEVADHALAMLLSFARGIPGACEGIRRSNEQWSWQAVGELKRLAVSTLGVIGLGRIGTAVALRARGFGMRVVYYDPYKPSGYDKALGVERCRHLTDLLAVSDYVSIHTPLTDETREMADARFFESLKREAVLINTARGAIVDLDALYQVLHSGRLRSAGLDVLPEEPPDRGHPLIRAWETDEEWIRGRLLITPHSAFWCREAYEEMRRKAAEEALRVLKGESALNPVNADSLRPSLRTTAQISEPVSLAD